ncbi:hypothetical protein SAMN04488049_1362 [Tritonibacter multivorans]|nr:hypothetical protein SAMN04488049_1362 [Tritonibacter multivorans]
MVSHKASSIVSKRSGEDRYTAKELQCNFDGYEGILNYEEASREERSVYALGMGYTYYGTAQTHSKLHDAFKKLDFLADRAPIVSADLVSGQLHVFDCKTDRCSREEISVKAPRSCMRALGADSCMTFAVRVNGNFYCTLGVGLSGE